MLLKRSSNPKVYEARRAILGILQVLFFSVFVYLLSVFLYRISTAQPSARMMTVIRFIMEIVACIAPALVLTDLSLGIFSWKKEKWLTVLGWIVRCYCLIVTLALLALAGKIAHPGLKDTVKDVDYVLVLGLALENGRAAEDMNRRVDAALAFEQQYPEATFLFSGGNNPNLNATEAQIMIDYFVSKKGNPKHALREPYAADTIQNFQNLAGMIDKTSRAAVITSDYHMLRVSGIMRNQRWPNVRYIPSESDRMLYGENVIWEAICTCFGVSKGAISLF